ncbi:MAG TPA: ScbA/BarX family gamma-butyrolactone biosynthesis protein [Streptomyces sp.]|uniref:ScbA/BarX family gamma-butyrolactone biosynthesis protein n=1 Tax=Streptomyces sp. TaxID=1931 RepID=UPI002B77FDD3|nr:ScbA/BarX family gamma-butyrolactone biosynthesis protein [Streptomyces sp.]HWU06569.1 ScbA/BarX family gamma-butyrolactone biosynthesis protein [Streptomyces sp.]
MPEIPVIPNPLPAASGAQEGVPEEFVHLRHSDMVFLTAWRRREDGEFSLAARWPAPATGLPYDPRVLTQTIRQSGLVIAHAAYGVPLTGQTLLNHFDFTVTPGFGVPSEGHSDLTVEVSVREPGKRGRTVHSLGMDVRVLQGDRMVARADSEFGWASPRAYRRLRGEHGALAWNTWPLPAPVDPRTVGRAAPSDVVLAAGDGPRHWQLRHDVDNVVLYDHPVDHVPGLVLMEAAHQAALAALHPAPFEATTVTSAFEQYAEFDRPCWIEAEILPAAPGEASVLVTATQDGEAVFRGRLGGPHG